MTLRRQPNARAVHAMVMYTEVGRDVQAAAA